jgi:hypothetical protein
MMSAEERMAATILHELFRARELNDFPGPFARTARRVAGELRELWEATSRRAAESRRVEALHAARDDYHSLLLGHLRLMEDYLALAELHRRAMGASPEWSEELARAVGELKALYDGLFPRWQSADDLRHLLIEKFSLPADRLRALAASHPPPPPWAEETADPFAD